MSYHNTTTTSTTSVADEMAFNINKVNRNFVLKNHIYFNKESWNTSGDATPRYFIKSVELLGVEKVAFTNKGRTKGYGKYGNRFWAYKNDSIADSDSEYYFGKIQTSYPYGFIGTDKSSVLRYEYDVKYNESFQSFYKTYWENNQDKIQTPQRHDGKMNYPFPYIEYVSNEVVAVKHPQGTVPAMSENDALYATYGEGVTYGEPGVIWCEPEELDVHLNNFFTFEDNVFWTDGTAKNPLTLASGLPYFFHLQSGAGIDTWPTGADLQHSGVKFSFSSGEDGTWNGHEEHVGDVWNNIGLVKRFEPVTSTNYFLNIKMKNGDPEDGHPYFNQGSISGYVISGGSFGENEKNSDPITVKRGHWYVFNQTGSSNFEHPVYISMGPSGNGDIETMYSSHTVNNAVRITGDPAAFNQGHFYWRVPLTAPDTLYYQSISGEYFGGQINVTDPSASDGNLPGHTVKFTPTNSGDSERLYYYSPDISGAGGIISLRTICPDR